MKTERYLHWQGLDSLDIVYAAWSVIFIAKPVVCLEMAHVMEIFDKGFPNRLFVYNAFQRPSLHMYKKTIHFLI